MLLIQQMCSLSVTSVPSIMPMPSDMEIRFLPRKSLRSSWRDAMPEGIALHCDLCYNNQSVYKVQGKLQKQKQNKHVIVETARAGNLHTLPHLRNPRVKVSTA